MRSQLRKRVTRGAEQSLKKFETQNPDSSEHALSLKFKDFAVPPTYATKNIQIQLREMYGKVELDKGLYHTQKYNDLMKTVTPIRKEFPKTRDVGAKK
jgi:hypothetical protein